MRTLGNILWHFPFFGFLSAALTYLVGVLLTITVIAAPIGRGLMEYGKFLFTPFSSVMVKQSDLGIKQNDAWKAYSTIVMLVWLPFGLLFGALVVIQTAFLFITIIGIPVAIVLAKSLGTYVNPVGKKCVSKAVSEEMDRRNAKATLDSMS
jgi:uncharacterized membrane protein YccF (DUF307 family)